MNILSTLGLQYETQHQLTWGFTHTIKSQWVDLDQFGCWSAGLCEHINLC
jgi:hypothetical protein